MLSHNLSKWKCSPTPCSTVANSMSPGTHTYQFVWMLTRCCFFGQEHFQTQIIYQLKSTLYRGYIRAICSKFIIINMQSSCRKLYNCKAFQKQCSDADIPLFDSKTMENYDLVGYSLTNIEFFSFPNNHF